MVKRINAKIPNDSRIYFVGDMHLGSKTFAKKEFEVLMKKIKNEKTARVVLMGDYGDFIESDDSRRYDPACIDKNWNTAEKQYQAILNYFKPIRDKILGILRGNHEHAYAKYHKEQFTLKIRNHAEKLAKELKVPYLEDMGIIKVRSGKKQFNLVTCHGVGSTSTLAGQIRTLNNIINGFEEVPDLVCMGHVHALQTIVNPKMDFKFATKVKHLGLTGNFYRTYIDGNENYASGMYYNPLPIGCIAYQFKQNGTLIDEKVIL